MKNRMKLLPLPLALLVLAALACEQATPSPQPTPHAPRPSPSPTQVDRLSTIPASAVKMTPDEDAWPPVAIAGWSQPEPLGAPVNTAGGEDSPFVLPDGQTLYFFFTPDVTIPAEKQLFDGVTGIWVTTQSSGNWSDPRRVLLASPGEVHLDGCEFVLGDLMYFCTAREGFTGIQWFRADLREGQWLDWRYAGDELKQNEYEVGELHLSADGQMLFFHSSRTGGYGGVDVWVSQKISDGWGEPLNLGPQVNTSGDEGWPFVSADGQELWFNGTSRRGRPGPAVFRCLRQPDGSWAACEEIVSQFAGEPTLTADGLTLYFVHHYFTADLSRMIEADIYVSYRLP